VVGDLDFPSKRPLFTVSSPVAAACVDGMMELEDLAEVVVEDLRKDFDKWHYKVCTAD